MEKKKWFDRGIYKSTDVPIRLLDKLIAVFIMIIILLVIVFAVNGGYIVSFDTDGGSHVATQKLRYGQYVAEPEMPVKPGYVLKKWVTSKDESLARKWFFETDKVEGEQTLYAIWEPALLTVKFDLNGGSFNEKAASREKQVTYGEVYGDLPVPKKAGARFSGWLYDGKIINDSTVVTMTGEHVLTAQWQDLLNSPY